MAVSRGVHCHDIRKPLGVVASIVPFSEPFSMFIDTYTQIKHHGNTRLPVHGPILDTSNLHCCWKHYDFETLGKSPIDNDKSDGVV